MDLSCLKEKAQSVGFSCLENQPLSKYTSFAIGGPAELLITVNNCDLLPSLLSFAKQQKIPVTVIGKGSNLLISDKGIDGAVFHICDERVTVEGQIIECFAGARLSKVCTVARENSLGGLEFAWGIPGSIGGAVYMNAGAYGGEMKQVICSCRSVDANGNIIERNANELQLGYRTSIYKSVDEVILSVKLKLDNRPLELIKADMDDYLSRRKSKQPLEYPSAGSTFKRPEGNFAGTLIEQCGLKGFCIGGAQVSEKHAGFIINKGNATCEDVLGLIDHVKETVYKSTGICLEPEVIFKGKR